MLITSDGELSNNVTLKYWKEMIQENEKLRFSQQSKDAFKLLKDVYKYNQFERRDGSIVSKVLEENAIVSDEKQVNRLLIEHLMSIQRS